MAEQIDDDPEIGSLNAHSDGEPPQAIVVTPGQSACDVKPHVLAVLPTFHGKSYEGPYEFIHEFGKICKAQKRPAGSSEDDYRLKALPFVLKGEANTWFMCLLLHYFLALNKPASIQSIYSIAKGQDRDIEHGEGKHKVSILY